MFFVGIFCLQYCAKEVYASSKIEQWLQSHKRQNNEVDEGNELLHKSSSADINSRSKEPLEQGWAKS